MEERLKKLEFENQRLKEEMTVWILESNKKIDLLARSLRITQENLKAIHQYNTLDNQKLKLQIKKIDTMLYKTLIMVEDGFKIDYVVAEELSKMKK